MSKISRMLRDLDDLDDAEKVALDELIDNEDKQVQAAVAKAKLPKELAFQDDKEPVEFAYPVKIYLDYDNPNADGGDVILELTTYNNEDPKIGILAGRGEVKNGIRIKSLQDLTKAVEKLAVLALKDLKKDPRYNDSLSDASFIWNNIPKHKMKEDPTYKVLIAKAKKEPVKSTMAPSDGEMYIALVSAKSKEEAVKFVAKDLALDKDWVKAKDYGNGVFFTEISYLI